MFVQDVLEFELILSLSDNSSSNWDWPMTLLNVVWANWEVA